MEFVRVTIDGGGLPARQAMGDFVKHSAHAAFVQSGVSCDFGQG
jgi:hypothetical protein